MGCAGVPAQGPLQKLPLSEGTGPFPSAASGGWMDWWAATGIWMLCGLLKSSVACGKTILGVLGVRKSRDWNLFHAS